MIICVSQRTLIKSSVLGVIKQRICIRNYSTRITTVHEWCFTFEQERHEWNNRRLEFSNTNSICSVVPAWVNKALELCVQLAELWREFLPCKWKPTHSHITKPHYNGKECIQVLILLTAANTINILLLGLFCLRTLLKSHMSLIIISISKYNLWSMMKYEAFMVVTIKIYGYISQSRICRKSLYI